MRKIGLFIVATLVVVRAFADVNVASTTMLSPEQVQFSKLTLLERQKHVEMLGEMGAAKLATSEGLTPLLAYDAKNYRQGFDQVWLGRDGTVVVIEAKGGGSPLGTAYGHVQGTTEHAVEGAKRILASSRSMEVEKRAARAILKAASEGKLQVKVVRTRHVFGRPSKPIVEKVSGTTEAAKTIAQEAIGSTKAAGAVATTTVKPAEDAACTLVRSINPGTVASSALKVGSRGLVVVGIGVEAYDRINRYEGTESAFARGDIDRHERTRQHAENSAEVVTAWAAAWASAQTGAALGGSAGTFVVPGIGTTIGAIAGGLVGGVGGYFGGQAVGHAGADLVVDSCVAR